MGRIDFISSRLRSWYCRIHIRGAISWRGQTGSGHAGGQNRQYIGDGYHDDSGAADDIPPGIYAFVNCEFTAGDQGGLPAIGHCGPGAAGIRPGDCAVSVLCTPSSNVNGDMRICWRRKQKETSDVDEARNGGLPQPTLADALIQCGVNAPATLVCCIRCPTKFFFPLRQEMLRQAVVQTQNHMNRPTAGVPVRQIAARMPTPLLKRIFP